MEVRNGSRGSPAAVKVGVLSHRRTSSNESPAGFSLRRLSITDWPVLDPITEGGNANYHGKVDGDAQSAVNPFLQDLDSAAGKDISSHSLVGDDRDELGKGTNEPQLGDPRVLESGQAPEQSNGPYPFVREEQGQLPVGKSPAGNPPVDEAHEPGETRDQKDLSSPFQEPPATSQEFDTASPFAMEQGNGHHKSLVAPGGSPSANIPEERDSKDQDAEAHTFMQKPLPPSEAPNMSNTAPAIEANERPLDYAELTHSLEDSIREAERSKDTPKAYRSASMGAVGVVDLFPEQAYGSKINLTGGIPEGLQSIQTRRLVSDSVGSEAVSFPSELMGRSGDLQHFPMEGSAELAFSPGALTSQGSIDGGVDFAQLFELDIARREAEQECAQLKLQLKSKTQQLEQVQEVLLSLEDELMKLRKEKVNNSDVMSGSDGGASCAEGEGNGGEYRSRSLNVEHRENGELKRRDHLRTSSSLDAAAVSLGTAEALSAKIVELQQQVQDLEESLIMSKLENVQLHETNEFLKSMVNKYVKTASNRKGKGINLFARNRTTS